MIILRYACFIGVILLSACQVNFEKSAQARFQYANDNQSNIVFAVFEQQEESDYVKGIELAVKQINTRPQKLLGRHLTLLYHKDDSDFKTTQATIRDVAMNPAVSAVLGHHTSSIAIPASLIYEKSQILFLPPFATEPKLTHHRFNYVFRMAPDNHVMSEQLASASQLLGYKRMALLYSNDQYSREFAFLFEKAAQKKQIKLVHKYAFFTNKNNYQNIVAQIAIQDFDAIFLSTLDEPGAKIVNQIRQMDITAPIISNDNLNTARFTERVGPQVTNVLTPTIYQSTTIQSRRNTHFIKHYQQIYHKNPNKNAAQGYDSLMLLAHVIEQTQSTQPASLASTLHHIPYWIGVTGIHAFNKHGDILGKKYVFQVLESQQWQFFPVIHLPYFLEKLDTTQSATPNIIVPSSQETQITQLDYTDYQEALLTLSHNIFQYKQLGLIYENTPEGKTLADYAIIHIAANKKQVDVIECTVAFSTLAKQQAEEALTECYGKLAPFIDVLYLAPFPGIEVSLINTLNNLLSAYQIPTLMIQKSAHVDNLNVILAFGQPRTNFKDIKFQHRLKGMLADIDVHKFINVLENIPIITANLNVLYKYGYLRSKNILQLSPATSE